MEGSIGSPLMWAVFTGFILAMLALDLGVFHRKSHVVTTREALGWSVVWIALSLAFNAWIYFAHGATKGLEFLTGYLIEKSLSVDNIFVFVLVFTFFAVPPLYHHRVLFWGVLGALVMRTIFIITGAALLERFHWIIYVFGAFLVVTGIKMLLQKEHGVHPENNPLVKLVRRVLPITNDYRGERFFVREAGRRMGTPLFIVLVTIEFTDLIFAVDSIPAIFAVTRDPFIVYTSNIFAILGLRSLYFLLAGIIDKFHYLKAGLALVLAFVGTKMLIMGVYKIPIGLSLAVVALLIAGSVVASLVFPKKTAG
ncbi:MAG: TerC family protein [Deltaproteobacteria bacterium]|nr:TerC family protein [Deltaproteobacteria bacterium]